MLIIPTYSLRAGDMPYQQLMEDRLRFLNIDQNTISELRNAKNILEPSIDEMLDNFYSHILQEPELKPLFVEDGDIERAHAAQKKHWMEALFNGKYDNAFYEKTMQIGRAHARIGLTPNWYIGGYNQMLCQFIELIYKKYADRGENSISLIQAVSKIIFLDMDLVIHCYLDAKDESLRRMLVSSTELRVEMWKFSDEMNTVTSNLNNTAKTLAADTQNIADSMSANTGSHSQELDEIHQCTQQLLAQIEQLKNHTSQLDGYLKKLPLSEKLYLPEASLLTSLKENLFGNKYHHN